jgi:hypothetical protein
VAGGWGGMAHGFGGGPIGPSPAAVGRPMGSGAGGWAHGEPIFASPAWSEPCSAEGELGRSFRGSGTISSGGQIGSSVFIDISPCCCPLRRFQNQVHWAADSLVRLGFEERSPAGALASWSVALRRATNWKPCILRSRNYSPTMGLLPWQSRTTAVDGSGLWEAEEHAGDCGYWRAMGRRGQRQGN